MQLNKYLDKFFTYLEVEKNYSSHTTLNYRIDLEEFAEFLGKISVEAVEYPDLRRFLAQLKEPQFKAAHISAQTFELAFIF